MISNGFKLTLLGFVVAAGVTATVLFALDNRRLRTQLEQTQRRSAVVTAARDENRRTQELVNRARASEAEGARALGEELVRVRREVAALEKRAEERRAEQLTQGAADAANFANNRDPGKAVARLEYFQDVGAATPRQALQTFIAASLKGDDAKMAGMIVVNQKGREKAEELIRTLPESIRSQWTAEKLGLQFFNGVFAEVPAAHIAGERLDNAQRASVELRLYGKANAKVVQPMQLGPQGWQIVVDDRNIAAVQKKMRLIAERAEAGK